MKPFSSIEKVLLISQLVTLLNSNIPIVEAITILMESDTKAAFFLKNTKKQLKMQKSVSVSLKQSGLLNQFELALLAIAESSGQLNLGLTDIQKRLERRHAHLNALKRKSYLPLIVFVIVILVTTLLSLVRDGPLHAFFHFLTALSYLLIVFFVIKLLLIQGHKAAQYAFYLFWEKAALRKIRLLRNIVEYNLYYNLSLQLKSGIDAYQASQALSKLCNHKSYLQSLSTCQALIASGSNLSSALSQSHLIFNNDAYQFIKTSEASGMLDSGLTSYLTIKATEIEDHIELSMAWASRIQYLIIIILALSLF